jgi:hypothetical protein
MCTLLQRSRRPRVEDLERVPQLQQRLRAYAAANSAPAPAPDQQLQANYNQKMKELLAIEEDLRRQEAALMAREKKLKGAVVLRSSLPVHHLVLIVSAVSFESRAGS